MTDDKEWLREKIKSVEEKIKNNSLEIEKLKKELKENTEDNYKSKSEKNNIQITDKDVILFRYLFENKFLTRKHIGEYIHSGLKYANQRLTKLSNTKYIKKLPHPLRVQKRTTYIMATKKALEYLKSDVGRDKLQSVKRNNTEYVHGYYKYYKVLEEPPLSRFKKDNKLNKIRFELENRGAMNWLTKHMRMISSNKNISFDNSDAIFEFPRNNKRFSKVDKITIILEDEIKGRKAYQQEYSSLFHSSNRNINQLIYLTEDHEIYNLIESAISRDHINNVEADKLITVEYLENFLQGENNFLPKSHNRR